MFILFFIEIENLGHKSISTVLRSNPYSIKWDFNL